MVNKMILKVSLSYLKIAGDMYFVQIIKTKGTNVRKHCILWYVIEYIMTHNLSTIFWDS